MRTDARVGTPSGPNRLMTER